jgi:GTP cyclohydrolase I
MEDEVRAYMRALAKEYGWRFTDEEFELTPKRAVAALDEWKRKHEYDKMTQFPQEERYGGMVIVRNIRVYAECSHHLLPFEGKAFIGYIPKEHVYGVSKLPRIVEKCGYQAQTQERMTREILDSIEAEDAIVVIKAKHLCMTMRGIGDEGEEMITSSLKGSFNQPEVRAEFAAWVGLK